MLTAWVLIPFAALCSNVALLLYALHIGVRQPVNRFFAAFTAALAWWSFCTVGYHVFVDADSYLLAVRLSAPVWIFVGPLLLHFVLVTLRDGRYVRHHPGFLLAYLPGVPLLLLRWFTGLLYTNEPVWRAWGWQQQPGPLNFLYSGYVEGFGLVALALLVRRIVRAKTRLERRRLTCMTIGIAVPFIIGTTTNLILPQLGINVYWSAVGLLSITGVCFAIAIFRYRMLLPTLTQSASAILRRMSQPVLLVGADERVLEANEAAQFLTDQSSEDVTGLPVEELLVGGRDTWQMLLDARDPDGQVTNVECAWVAAGAEEVPMLLSLTTLGDPQDRLEGYLLFGTDYREIHAAQQAVRESEELYRTLHENAVQGVLLARERIVKANPEALRIFGAAEDEILGAAPDEFWPEVQPDGRRSVDAAREYVWAALAGRPQFFLWRCRRLDGTPIDCETALQAVTVGGERFLQAAIRDVTEQRRLQAALEHLHDSTVGVVGQQYLTTLTQHLAEWLGTTWAQVGEVDPEDPDRLHVRALWQAGAPGEVYDVALPGTPCALAARDGLHICPTGAAAAFPNDPLLQDWGVDSYVGVALRDPAGATIGVLCAFDTEPLTVPRTEMETLLELFAERASAELLRLRAVAHEREQAERLRELQKMESIGLLAGGVAHDFNNILVGVLGHASLARELLEPDSPAHRSMEIIEHSAERAVGLTDQLLAYARGGKHNPEPLDLVDLVGDLLQMLGAVLPKSVDIRAELEPDTMAVLADESQMQQVIMNLCTNAGEAMGEGGGTLTVRLRTEPSEGVCSECGRDQYGPQVVLAIADTGCGMDDGTQRQIFDPFFSTKEFGRGLGLSAVQGIVLNHGGCMHFDSAPGLGTTFRLYLPAHGLRSDLRQTPPAAALEGGTETVLVAEDEPIVAEFARDILLKLGYRVLTAATGDEALDLYQRHRAEIHLVLLDMIMPGRSGLETLEAMRALDPELKAIVTSGYAEDQLLSPESEAAPNAFLKKPYRPAALAAVVRQVLAQQRQTATP